MRSTPTPANGKQRQKTDDSNAKAPPPPKKSAKNSSTDNSNDLLSVVVFKDHLTPRTFHFPRFWINHFGLLLLLAGVITLASLGTSFRYSYLLRNARRDYSREMEEERRAQEVAREAQENKAALQKSGISDPTQVAEAEKPKKDPAEKNTAAFLGNLFGTFPANTVRINSDLSQSPITIENTAIQWRDKGLKVHFELHYNKDDGGNQKGRIYILARGPDTLLSYPQGSLEPVGSPGLLSENRGEQFSVSRLRMVDAVFEGYTNRNQIRNLEVIIISLENELLIHQSLAMPNTAVTTSASTESVSTSPSSPTSVKSKGVPKSAIPVANDHPQGTQPVVPPNSVAPASPIAPSNDDSEGKR